MYSFLQKLLVAFLLHKAAIATACLVDETVNPTINQETILKKRGLISEQTKRTTVISEFIKITFQEKEIDGIEPDWQSLYLSNGKKRFRLPDVVNSHLTPKDIIWCRNRYILFPGMSFGGTDHRQWNDTALVKITQNGIHYMGMINSYLQNQLTLPENKFAATYAAFDFSPYGFAHVDGISIIVILKEKDGKLITDISETYQANRADDELNQSNLSKTLESTSKFQTKAIDCNSPESEAKCLTKNTILHYALKRATLMRYLGKKSELDDINSQLRTSALIHSADINKFNKYVYEIEPKETNFLFWRRKPNDWFNLKD